MRINALILFLFISSWTYGQGFELILDHVALEVQNLEESSKFYSEVLKLKELPTPNNNPKLRWFDLGNNRQLHLILTEESYMLPSKSVHFSLACSDLPSFIKELEVPYESWLGENSKISDRPDGIQQIYIQDNSGYWIEINNVKY